MSTSHLLIHKVQSWSAPMTNLILVKLESEEPQHPSTTLKLKCPHLSSDVMAYLDKLVKDKMLVSEHEIKTKLCEMGCSELDY